MTSILTLTSFGGREHSDRRYAPSEHMLRERRPESITAVGAAMRGRGPPPHRLGLWIPGSSASRERHLATPRNDDARKHSDGGTPCLSSTHQRTFGLAHASRGAGSSAQVWAPLRCLQC